MAADRTDERQNADAAAEIDLSPLDPTARGAGFDRAVASIVEGAGFELARRRGPGLFDAVPSAWGRVAWPAAAAVALASLAVLRAGEPAFAAAAADVTIEEEMARAVGVPEALAVWVGEDGAPVLSEILIGWEPEE
ncbi:MAG: hypothetical protein ACC682_06150 [Gemmatimonadota bacterium]